MISIQKAYQLRALIEKVSAFLSDEDVLEAVEPFPVWRQPTGAQDAYMIGDRVWYSEKDTTIYENLIDYNVYSPEAYPVGWRKI